MQASERYRGSLLGLATGDALGTTLEFKRPGSGEQGIPEPWQAQLALRERIIEFADHLCSLAESKR